MASKKKTASKPPLDLWRGFESDNPAQIDFLKSDKKYRLLSSGRGGGKSVVGCRESLRCVFAYPGSRNMVSRMHFPDLERSTHQTLKNQMQAIGLEAGYHYRFHKSQMVYEFLNGSEILLTNLDDEEKFGSVEVSTIFIDEGSEVPDSVYQMLFPANLRWQVGPHRAWICTNPGASGYLKQVVEGRMPDWGWFPVPPGGNKHNPPGYNEDLERLGRLYGPVWFQRYVEGSWDAFEGARFGPLWDWDQHVIDGFVPDEHWDIYEGVDFGWRAPTAIVWIAVDPRGEYPPVVFHEYEQEQREVPDHAREIKRIRSHYKLSEDRIISFCDPAGKQTGRSGKTDIDLYREEGIVLIPCHEGKEPTDRADAIAPMLARRMATKDGTMAGLLFDRRCKRAINAFLSYRYKPQSSRLGEDPREQFLKQNDHLVDAAGYALIMVPRPSDTELLIEDEIYANVSRPMTPDAVKEWRRTREREQVEH